MRPIFSNNILNLSELDPSWTVTLALQNGCERAEYMVRPGDLLAAALTSGDSRLLATLSGCLLEGSSIKDIISVLEVYRPKRKTESDFDGTRARFAEETLAALNEFEARVTAATAAGLPMAKHGLGLLVASVLNHLDQEDREYITCLDTARAIEREGNPVPQSSGRIFEDPSELPNPAVFNEEARAALETAGKVAGAMAYEAILSPHVFVALLMVTQGSAEKFVRRRLRPELSITRLLQLINEGLRRGTRKLPPISATQTGFGEATLHLLGEAQELAARYGLQLVDPECLLAAVLANPPPKLADLLEGTSVGLRVAQLLADVEEYLRQRITDHPEEPRVVLPNGALPSEDLTWCARTGALAKADHLDAAINAMARGLFRRHLPHVILTGLRGVGKTTAIRELARRAAIGEIPFLKRKRFLWVNCQDVPKESSRAQLDAVLTFASGRTDLVLCLDGLDTLLRGASDSSQKVRLRGALKNCGFQMLGILSDTAFQDLLAADHEFLACCTRVSLAEPDVVVAKKITREAAGEVAREFKIRIEPRAIERAVDLASNYILNERLPAKSIGLLHRACEDLDYARLCQQTNRDEVNTADVIRVVASITGIPEATLAGEGDKVDYEKSLGEWVVGQAEAVQAAAAELQLIKAGLSHAGKPASVMFFAGLTGCGKTELAKALAQFYSASKRLQTITMGNFTEAHSVSGIIGVPPGYVGHEQGGRLINDLNADPYCVFLLDEAEKAHPDIWKPFLNLFDEGWVVDQRGVKAFAEQAIIILTSNAGNEIIAAESERGTPTEEIVAAVKKHLTELRHGPSGQRVFTPEFLARIGRVIIFRPLDCAAMEGICRKMVARFCAFWRERREQSLVVPDDLILKIARLGHEENRRSGGKEGGRILDKLIRRQIEEVLRREWERQESVARQHNTATLTDVDGQWRVEFHTEPPRKPEASLAHARSRVSDALKSPPPGPAAFNDLLAAVLTELKGDLETWSSGSDSAPDSGALAEARKVLTEWQVLLEAQTTRINEVGNESWAQLARTVVDTDSEAWRKDGV